MVAVFEVLAALALLEAALWTTGRTQLTWGLLMLAWIVARTFESGRSARELGLSAAGLLSELWVVAAALATAALMILSSNWLGLLHDLHGARAPVWHALLYAIWAFVQQFLAQSFIFLRLQDLLGSGKRAVLATAAIFSAAHLPNPVLMIATLAMCLAWSELFRRYRNLYPLAIGHAILGLALAVSMSDAVTHHMRVGIAYWK